MNAFVFFEKLVRSLNDPIILGAKGLKQSWFLFELHTYVNPGSNPGVAVIFELSLITRTYTLEQSFETGPLLFYASQSAPVHNLFGITRGTARSCCSLFRLARRPSLEEKLLFTINCWQTCSRKSMAIVRHFDPSLEIHQVNNSRGCSRFDADGKSCLRCSKSNVRNPLGGL